MKLIVITIVLFAFNLQVIGQNHLPDNTLERDFKAQVKSIDEFISRFNGDEAKPGLSSDSLGRRNNIISLFDSKIPHTELVDDEWKKLVLDFIDTSLAWSGKLSISEEGTYADAKCCVKYGGKNYYITLLLKREKTARGKNKWAIAGVKGMSALGLFSDKRLTISPVDHETHFMSLHDFFHANQKITSAMRSNEREIDEMSFFFGMCVTKAIEFVQVDDLKFHFMDIPGYVFVVEEIGRQGTNCGWLITQLKKTDDIEKELYKKHLFGIK